MKDTDPKNEESIPFIDPNETLPTPVMPSEIDADDLFYGKELSDISTESDEGDEKAVEEMPSMEDLPLPPCPYCNEELIRKVDPDGTVNIVHKDEHSHCYHTFHSLIEIVDTKAKVTAAREKIARQPETYNQQKCPICGKDLIPHYDDNGDLSYFYHDYNDDKDCRLIFSSIEEILSIRKMLYRKMRNQLAASYTKAHAKDMAKDGPTLLCPYCHELLTHVNGSDKYGEYDCYIHGLKDNAHIAGYKDIMEDLMEDTLCQAVFRDAEDVLQTAHYRAKCHDTSPVLLCPVCHEPLEVTFDKGVPLFKHKHSSCEAIFKESLSELEKNRWMRTKEGEKESSQEKQPNIVVLPISMAELHENAEHIPDRKNREEDTDPKEDAVHDIDSDIPEVSIPWFVKMFRKRKA